METTTATKLDISIVVPGLPFNGSSFPTQSLGGSESAGYYMARALTKRGHNVTVFGNGKPERAAEADFQPLPFFRQFAEYSQHDVTIVQRAPEYLTLPIKSRFTGFWCHDLALKRSAHGYLGTLPNYDKLFVLSEFMRDQYKQVLGLPDEAFFLTRNGVDLDLVNYVRSRFPTSVTRNPLTLIYSARPERGLDVLLGDIMPRILVQEPKARLFLSAYQNKVDHLEGFYKYCMGLADKLGDRVVYLGHLSKDKLYEAYLSAGVYAYPTPSKLAPTFDEISCISLMEAQACGLPIVTTNRGALPETLAPDAGTLIKEPVHTDAYYDAFASACIHYMRDVKARNSAGEAGLVRAQSLGWDAVAKDWEELFLREIRAKSADLATLANHFWRRSDIYAAKECLRRLPKDDVKSRVTRQRIAKDWAFIDEEDGFRKQYERIGATHNADVINWAKGEPRYSILKDWLEAKPDLSNVLDYGCAHGAYAANLLKDIPRLRVTGMDIDIQGIELGTKFVEGFGVSDRWLGVVGDYARLSDPNIPEFQGRKYDVAIAQEVLEHVPDPGAVIAALEERVRDGGWVYITVPFGPWEYTDYTRYPYRAHVWEFDLHDLYDLFDVKDKKAAELSVQTVPFSRSPLTNEALGWWVMTYRVTAEDRGKVGKINLDRKLWLQRPRQTVTATIMAGGPAAEETLLWCLRSIEHVADEVVVADCGLSEAAHSVLALSPFKDNVVVIKAPDPKKDGFETPRNEALKVATQDWALWIDTDEKLLDPQNLHKYLKHNLFQGYSIPQVHLAADTKFNDDFPVRLFRNNGKLRFFGMIHEHPESEINEGPGRTVIIHDTKIAHVGYLIESGRQTRFDRNLPMLQADIRKYPNRKLQKHFIMRDNMLIVGYQLKASGGKITPDMLEMCREVVMLYREHFMGKGHFTSSDPLQYYSQACQVLASIDGSGFQTTFQFNAGKENSQPGDPMQVRFMNTEDALAELTFRVKEASNIYDDRYY